MGSQSLPTYSNDTPVIGAYGSPVHRTVTVLEPEMCFNGLGWIDYLSIIHRFSKSKKLSCSFI